MRWRTAIALSLGLVLGCCVWFRPPPPEPDPDEQAARLVSRYTWTRPERWFGGFSGLEVSADGETFLAVTDRGHLLSGQIRRRQDEIIGIRVLEQHRLRDETGGNITLDQSDSEGLALADDGRLFVSFEGVHRVWLYAQPFGPARAASDMNEFPQMEENGSLEALAVDERNRVYTLTEEPRAGESSAPVYRSDQSGQDPTWRVAFHVPRRGDFLPVGMDFGPDGRLYLLERDVYYPFGLMSRVRAFRIEDDRILSEEMVLQTPLGSFDNLEGISVWKDTAGRIRLTLVSDDNFLPVQRTELVEFVLTE